MLQWLNDAADAIDAVRSSDSWRPMVGTFCEARMDGRWRPVHVMATEGDVFLVNEAAPDGVLRVPLQILDLRPARASISPRR
ncbi:MAG TPA: hypothetical protein VFQ42_22400 [Mycobacterium sp.]|nr:hypothetical protein [Mycobacterium sp.]